MATTLEIRQVRPEDLDSCASIEDVCYHGHGASRERIGKRIREYPEGFLVGLEGKDIVGFVNSGCFRKDSIAEESLKDLDGHDPAGGNVVIFSLAVRPDRQKRGISRLLMERFITDARAAGKERILLVCREHLLGYYGSYGFRWRAPSALTFGGHAWSEMVLPLRDS